MFELGLKALVAYLVGSVSGALTIGALRGGVDIRDEGSGNAGGTNALRTQGVLFALGVVIIDIGKGFIAAYWVPFFDWPPADVAVDRRWLIAACGAAAVIGHIWPFWHGFRGGKGAGTLVGVFAAMAPKILAPVLVVWLVCVISSGYVGLSTMAAATAGAAAAFWLYPGQPSIATFAAAMAALIVFTHRSNIRRMLSGNENRMDRLMLWRRSKDNPP